MISLKKGQIVEIKTIKHTGRVSVMWYDSVSKIVRQIIKNNGYIVFPHLCSDIVIIHGSGCEEYSFVPNLAATAVGFKSSSFKLNPEGNETLSERYDNFFKSALIDYAEQYFSLIEEGKINPNY